MVQRQVDRHFGTAELGRIPLQKAGMLQALLALLHLTGLDLAAQVEQGTIEGGSHIDAAVGRLAERD